MSLPSTTRTLCRSCRRKLLRQPPIHNITTTATHSLPPRQDSLAPRASLLDSLRIAQDSVSKPSTPSSNTPGTSSSSPSSLSSIFSTQTPASTYGPSYPPQPYHLHLYTHKHNTHLTFTTPQFTPILSYSCGQLGLRKAQRGSFDAAYNLCTFFFSKMKSAAWREGGKNATKRPQRTLADVKSYGFGGGASSRRGGESDNGPPGQGIEVILRGYGPGREALQKALLGQDGRGVKELVVKVTDATRLKFGGTRSPAVRRLG